MAGYSASKITVGYHTGEPNEVTPDRPPLRILMTSSTSDPATFADDNQPNRNADTGL
jgi:hypothetical protein